MSEANIIIEHESDGGQSISLAENVGKMNIRVDRDADVERRTPVRRPPPPPQQPRKRAPPPQMMPPPPPARPYVPGADAFKDFANPTKKRHEEFAREEESVGDIDESIGEASSFDRDDMRGGGGGGQFEGDDDGDDFEDEVRPSLGFKSIEEEKHDIILKLHRLKQRGFPVTRNFTLTSDIYEMRTELSKIKYTIELDASVKFSRKMLMGAVSTIEFVNKKWNPFDLALEGWSENMMETIDDYDLIFEKLHDKYKDKVAMPPEMELLLAVSGSAFMYHLSHSMLRSLGPEIAAKIKKNPEIVKSAMREAVAEDQQKRAEHERNQRQMKGPQVPLPTQPQPQPQTPPPTPTFEPPIQPTPPPPPTMIDPPRPRPRPRAPTPSSSDGEDSFDSRLSDVPSEDLKSVASSLDGATEVKTVTVAPRAARGRGAGRGGGRGGRGAAATDAAAKEIRVLNI